MPMPARFKDYLENEAKPTLAQLADKNNYENADSLPPLATVSKMGLKTEPVLKTGNKIQSSLLSEPLSKSNIKQSGSTQMSSSKLSMKAAPTKAKVNTLTSVHLYLVQKPRVFYF